MRSFFAYSYIRLGKYLPAHFLRLKHDIWCPMLWHMIAMLYQSPLPKKPFSKTAWLWCIFGTRIIYIYIFMGVLWCGVNRSTISNCSGYLSMISNWQFDFEFSIFIWDHDPQVAHIFEISGSTTKQIHPRMFVSYLEDFSMVEIQTSWGWWVFDLNICKTTSFCSACQVRVSRF